MSSTYHPGKFLGTLEIELNLVTNTFESWHATYTDNITRENYEEAIKNLTEVIRINDKIIELVTRGITIIDQATMDNITYDTTDVLTLDQLVEILYEHESIKTMLAKEEINIANIVGKLDISQQTYQTNYLQYIIIVIVGAVVAVLTAKTIITQDDSNLKIAILVIIAGLIVYFVITNLNI